MEKLTVESYIQHRLRELEKEKDLDEFRLKGKLSFGIDSREYAHLPAWTSLVRQKKIFIRMVWVNAIAVSLMIVLLVGNVWEKIEISWIRGLAYWLTVSAVILFLEILTSYYSLFYHVRQTDREIRKLIYQDILHRMKEEKS